MARPSRHIAYAQGEMFIWEDGRRRGRAAVAPIRMPRRGKVRDRTYARFCGQFLRPWMLCERPSRTKHWVEKLVTSAAARLYQRESERRWQYG